MFIFDILATWKCDFRSFFNGSYLFNDFGYTCVGIRNNCKYHHFLNVNSDCVSSNTRISNCISMSNDESLIYVLLTWVFYNVHFRHFGELKMRFLLICHRVLLSQWFWIYLCWDLKYLQRAPLSQCKLRLLDY